MRLARKSRYVHAIVISGVLAAFIPGVVEATPVDPTIIARFKKLAPPPKFREMFHAGDSRYLTYYHHPRLPACARAKS
jgi:hypothetical protein